MTVNQRKHELKKKYVDQNEILAAGRRAVLLSVLIIFFARIAFFIFELAFFAAKGITVSIISNLLILPLCLILYMIYDGNKGLAGVLAISAIVRAIYLFSAVYPTLPTDSGAGIFVGLYLFVMAFQFVAIILMTAYTPCVKYFEKMQAINMELGAMLRAGGSSASGNKKRK